MASVPNMRPTAGIPAGEGKAPADGEAGTANSPFATLLAIGAPKAADAPAQAPAPGAAVALLAALREALAGGRAPTATAGEADASPAPTDDSDEKAGSGADDSVASDDLVPLIEAQNAAPVIVTPVQVTPAAPPPTSDLPAEPDAKASPRVDGRPMRASGHPGRVEIAAAPQAPILAAPLPATVTAPEPAASAETQAPIEAAVSGDAPPAKTAEKIAPRANAEAGKIKDADPKPAGPPPLPSAPVLHARDTAPKVESAPAAPTLAEAEKPAQAAQAAPQPTAPNPFTALQAALGTLAERGPDPARPAGGPDNRAEAPIAERVMGHQLDLARDSLWLDRLARDIASSADADGPMRFKLHPETLGQMRVELSQGERGTSVRLTVETEAARAVIADAQPKLVAEARAQGVRIAETHVDLAGGSGGQASSDPRRHEAAREPVFVRTAPDAADRVEPEGQSRRGRGERYA